MKWKHFTDEESFGLKDDLMHRLDRARDLFGFPLVITSGYRDPAHNQSAGGVQDSAHTTGQAVDLRCADSEMQKRLCWALGAAGFHRIGVYSRHVHVDVDASKPMPAYWTGESK
jgi:zinc D-Ala-D-Ala carboxypeptidase